ncbi:hypothetical protein ATANTOWER_001975 [Ataeniobius toweri]|uniref:Uncharacterized protein n=1 Tax=Ataeniobius toweri TaxID=208326 RepID=A0ABU7B6T3_9TELE|nr:hypothetical protein [Ataeniobius toweri]
MSPKALSCKQYPVVVMENFRPQNVNLAVATLPEPLKMIVQRILHKKNITDNPEDPLHPEHQEWCVFSQKLLQVHCDTDCYRRSLLPTAITIYHKSLKKLL